MESRRGSQNSEHGQKEAFLNELSQFLSDKGRYVCRSPNLAGRTIDLHDLYNKITQAGGYQKVTDRGFWEDFLEYYGFPGISATLAFGLQKIYQLYLEDYERVHFFGDDEAPSYSRLYDGKLRRYRYPVSDMQRYQYKLNREKPSVSDYDRVVLSLESCLPNEIDFAVNACTLLSGESRHVLKLPQCRRIVDALLLHAGIVSDSHDTYRGVLEELQRKTKHNYRKFWNNSVTKKSVLSVLLPPQKLGTYSQEKDNKFVNAESSEELLSGDLEQKEKSFIDALQKRLLDIEKGNGRADRIGSDSQVDTKPQSKWSELFHGYRSLGVEDYEGQRVLQIALVLLNLSFEDFNVTLLAQHPSLIRFVFLCIHSEYSCLRQTGLDILSNISSRMQLLDLQLNMTAMIFDAIHSAVLSDDKFERIRGFEILANICRPRVNVDYVCVSVNEEVYNAAIQNLMINDVELLLSAIEALYRLSKLGESTCTKIIFIRGCIDILICLVTLNVRTFGPEKLSEIRLARRITPGQQQAQQQQPTYHIQGQHAIQQHPNQQAPHMHRQMHLQQKIGSAHQAQPFFATAAPTNPVPTLAPPTPQSRPPLPPPKAPTPQPKPQAPNVTPTPPPPPQAPQNPAARPPAPVQQPPPVIKTPPPAPQVVVPKSSPPGVGPTYTHSETGTVPPVFHYMPAPPTEITQDNSPESFTKLWIWATYEFESESYIPRVDVYCEYLASSNRYGRQGKTEILSATDFGKCLKEIFPQASSRLFNQGRGQPQYHIAGIKKRATPLPVPGYQLKDPSSTLSSEYEKIPATSSQPTITVSANSQQSVATSSSAIVKTPPISIPGITTAVPIQQLNFQPIYIMSTIPGSNGVSLLPGMAGQTVAVTGQVVTPVIQTVALAGQVMTQDGQIVVTNAQSTASGGQSVVVATGIPSENEAPSIQCAALNTQGVAPNALGVTSNDQCEQNTASTSLDDTKVTQKDNPQPVEETVAPNDATFVTENALHADKPYIKQSVESVNKTEASQDANNETNKSSDTNSDMPKETVTPASDPGGTKLMPQVNTNSITNDSSTTPQVQSRSKENEAECSKENNKPETDSASEISGLVKNNHTSTEINHTEHINTKNMEEKALNGPTNSTPIMNGFPEPMDASTTNDNEATQHNNISNATSMEVDKAEEQITKSRKSRKISKESTKEKTLMVNGFDQSSEILNKEKPLLNGSSIKQNNDKLFETCGNKLNCENTNLKPNVTNSQVNTAEVNLPGNTAVTAQEKTANTFSISDAISESLKAMNSDESELEPNTPKCTEQSCSTINTEEVANIFGMDSAPRPTSGISTTPSIMPCVSNTPSTQTMTPVSKVMTPSTPTNPIPHSALNQRLKDTITRRKNSQTTPASVLASTPVSITPAPSVVKQYAYKGTHPGRDPGTNLAQQIISVTPQQLQQQFQHQHRQQQPATPGSTNNTVAVYQGTPQVGNKRPHPQATVSLGTGPPAKILRSTAQPPTTYTPTPQQVQIAQQQQRQFHPPQVGTPRPQGAVYRPPVPQQHPGVRPSTPAPNPQQVPGSQQKPKPPTIDLMAPNASLLVLYRNVGKIPFANHLDEKEDAISKSVRLTASLILTNIARYSDLGRGLIQKHEEQLANVAMSQMDCSPIVARLLSEIDL